MKLFFAFLLCLNFTISNSQNVNDSAFSKTIFNYSLTQSSVYHWLDSLTTTVGNRLSGSSEAAKAVNLTRNLLVELDLDSTWLQPCIVPHWEE